jgi:DNA-binding transcriptional regulator/RsmH inhibitor MraZ
MLIYHETITAISINGTQFSADKEGRISVPDDLAKKIVQDFGFIVIDSDKKGEEKCQRSSQTKARK